MTLGLSYKRHVPSIRVGVQRGSSTRSRMINPRFQREEATLGDRARSCETEGCALRHRERQLPVRHTFSLSQRTLLFSRCSLGHEPGATRPRQMFRDACPFASASITYLYLEPGRARRVTRDRQTERSIDAYARFSTRASKNATDDSRRACALDSCIHRIRMSDVFYLRANLSFARTMFLGFVRYWWRLWSCFGEC